MAMAMDMESGSSMNNSGIDSVFTVAYNESVWVNDTTTAYNESVWFNDTTTAYNDSVWFTDTTTAYNDSVWFNDTTTAYNDSVWFNDTTTTTAMIDDPYAESPAIYYFRRIVPGLLLFIGVPGNILSMMVMCRKFFRKTSAGVYLFVLLIADTVYLFSNYSFIFWMINNFKTFELVHSTVSCKMWVYLMETSGYISSWVLTVMTIERAIIVRQPHRRSAICTKKRAAIIITIITLVIALMNSYILITFESVENRNKNPIRPTRGCYFTKPYSSYLWLLIVYNLAPFLMYAFLPACCIIISNLTIVCTLAQRPKVSSNLSRDAEARKITTLLMGACIFFVVGTVPVTTLVFLEQILNKFLRMRWVLLNTIYLYAMVLLPLNQSFNFMVYCLSGTSFRTELKAMFMSCCKRIKCMDIKKKLPGFQVGNWARIDHLTFSESSANSRSSTGAKTTETTSF